MRVVMVVLNDMTVDARVTREATALAAAGHTVTVLALRSSTLAEREVDAVGFEVRRVADYTSARWNRPLSKFRQARARSRALAEAAVLALPDVIHCHDADTLDMGARVAGSTGALLVYDAHELYPDMVRADRSGVLPGTVAYWRRLEKRLLSRAHLVITVSEDLAEEMERRHGVRPEVILNVAPLEPLGDRDRIRVNLGLKPESVIVLYQGLVGRGRGIEALIHALPGVPTAVLVVQGYGALVGQLQELAREAHVTDRVLYVGQAPMRDLHSWACGADIGDVLLEDLSLNNYLAGPNKLYRYLMAGIPMIGSDFPGIRRIVVGNGVGRVCRPGDAASVRETLRALVEDSDGRREMGARARLLAESRYNWEKESERLVRLYDELPTRPT